VDYAQLPTKIANLVFSSLENKISSLQLSNIFEEVSGFLPAGISSELDARVRGLLYHPFDLENQEADFSSKYFLASIPVYICGATCESPEQALPISVAMHFFITAAQLFDDFQDEDKTKTQLLMTRAEILDIALILMGWGYELLVEAIEGWDSKNQVQSYRDCLNLVKRLSRVITLASRGQLLDLDEKEINSENLLTLTGHCFRKAALKTAFIVRYLAEISAKLNMVSDAQMVAYQKFGFSLGMAWHIFGDLTDFEAGLKYVGSSRDLANRHLTIPYALAYQIQAKVEKTKEVLNFWSNCQINDTKVLNEQLANPEIIMQTTFLILQYLAEARQALKEIDSKLEREEHRILLDYLQRRLYRFQPYLTGKWGQTLPKM